MMMEENSTQYSWEERENDEGRKEKERRGGNWKKNG